MQKEKNSGEGEGYSWVRWLDGISKIKQEHRLAGADRSSIFFLKVKGLSFSITKEGGVE
ncbi:hypothetical protein DPMN_019941 [Dreissena polymorpha]|uniref:Uncharacterized protein n=1 Tax=Dreissena polymorpha TaxID=45954 RepID=A0A9D4NJC4_DREPO|nr:hypothetical protein DPMN_019941 [Dreissena polymorpha]